MPYKKITSLAAATAITSDDLFVMVDSPASGAANKKITLLNVLAYLATSTNTLTLTNEGLHLLDTDGSHDLVVKPGSNLTADRILTITTGDAARTLTFSADVNFGAAFTTSGGHAITLTTTGVTSITLPTTGTLATTSNKLSAFSATTSAELAGVISDETGSGTLVFATGPTLIVADIKGTSATDSPGYSSEFLGSSGWTSTGWTGSFAAGWTHTAGNTSVLSQSTPAVVGIQYQIAWTITGRTAGTITVAFGGESLAGIQPTSSPFGPTAISTANLTVTPTSDFDGTVVMSIKSLVDISDPVSTYKSSDGTSKFEIRANTGLYNTFVGKNAGQYNTTGDSNSVFGWYAGTLITTGYYNTIVGASAGREMSIGYFNSLVGESAGLNITTGYRNSIFGVIAGYSLTTGFRNVLVGDYAGYAITTASGNVFLGSYAGRYETGSNKLFIDNAARDNESDARVKALIYGIFDAAIANQYVTINGNLYVHGSGKVQISSDGVLSWGFSANQGVLSWDTGQCIVGGQSGNDLILRANGVEVARLSATGGNYGLGQTTFGTNATKTLAVGTGVAPTTSPADAFQMYSADQVGGNACPHIRTENGAVVKLFQAAANADTSGATLAQLETELNEVKALLRANGLLAT